MGADSYQNHRKKALQRLFFAARRLAAQTCSIAACHAKLACAMPMPAMIFSHWNRPLARLSGRHRWRRSAWQRAFAGAERRVLDGCTHGAG
jgi:hypothetical protein